MSQRLTWNGADAVEATSAAPDPGAHDVRIDVHHSLFEQAASLLCHAGIGVVQEAGNHTKLDAGDRVACVIDALTSQVTVSSKQCVKVGDLAPEQALLIPPVARVLHLMENLGADLGWTAVVTGRGLAAELTRQIAHIAGARQVLACVGGKLATVAAGHEEEADAADGESLETALADIDGPILGIETTTHPAEIQSLLTALPPRSTVALHGDEPGGVTAVNFYLDVHRKNMRILGNSGRVLPSDLERAVAVLQAGRLSLAAWPVLETTAGNTPESPAGTPGILAWASA